MNNSILEIVIKARDEASAKVAGISSKLKDMEPTFKKMAAVGTVAFGAIAAVAGDALKEFAEDQAQMAIATQDLNNALENMSASGLNKIQKEMGEGVDIFGAMEERMKAVGTAALKLGFDDEAASAAFAKLFKVTKDTAQANKELQIAMDLARNKGIDLDAAVKILTMTHAGATKELKAQGIEIDENASALENINKISLAVTGSASTYAQTAKGQWEIMTNAINNAKSALGEALAPVLASILEKLQPIIEKVLAWIEANPELVKWIIIITAGIAGLVAILGILGLVLPPIIAGFTILLGPVGLVILAIAALIALVALIIAKWTPIKEFFLKIWEGIKKIFQEAVQAVIAFFQPLIDVINYVISLIEKVAGSIGKVVQQAGGFVKGVAADVKSGVSAVGEFITGKKAQGGRVSGGSSYIVGEAGPELFSPCTGGMISPNGALAGGGGVVVNINGGNYLSEDAAEKMGDYIVQSLKRVSRIGM